MKKVIKTRIFLVVIIISVIGLNSGTNAGENFGKRKSYRLEYKMQKNTEWKVTGHMFFQRTSYMEDGITGNTIEDDAEALLRVIDNKSDGLKLETEFLKVQKENNNPGGRQLIEFFKAKGHKVTFGLSADGKISDIEGFKDFPEKDIILRRTHPFRFSLRLSGIFPALPQNTVDKEETWTNSSVIKGNMIRGRAEIKVDYTYKVTEEKVYNNQQCVVIEAVVDETFSFYPPNSNNTEPEIIKGKGKETIYFCPELGILLYKEGEINYDGIMFVNRRKDVMKYKIEVEKTR